MKRKKQNVIVNFKKARSLLDTIIRMLEEDRYCVDIMQQNLAALGLLRRAHEQLMSNHLKTCFADALKSKSDTKRERVVNEVETLIKFYNKT